MELVLKTIDLVLKTIDLVLKTMDLVLKTIDLVLKTIDLVLKTMDLVLKTTGVVFHYFDITFHIPSNVLFHQTGKNQIASPVMKQLILLFFSLSTNITGFNFSRSLIIGNNHSAWCKRTLC